MAELEEKSLAVSMAVVWGLSVLLLGWLAAFTGVGAAAVNVLGSFYVGFNASVVGGIIGLVYGLIDGAIGGFLIALVYNWASENL